MAGLFVAAGFFAAAFFFPKSGLSSSPLPAMASKSLSSPFADDAAFAPLPDDDGLRALEGFHVAPMSESESSSKSGTRLGEAAFGLGAEKKS